MKKIIIVSGLPGSGKSTLSEDIAEKLHLPLFSVDPIESSIIKSGIKKSFETGLAAYLVAQTLASEHLKLGQSVILDAVSGIKEARDMWNVLVQKHGANLVVIECVVDEQLHKKRIESRVRNLHGFREVTWDDVEKRRKDYVEWEEERLILDTANSKDSNLKKALQYIQNKERVI